MFLTPHDVIPCWWMCKNISHLIYFLSCIKCDSLMIRQILTLISQENHLFHLKFQLSFTSTVHIYRISMKNNLFLSYSTGSNPDTIYYWLNLDKRNWVFLSVYEIKVTTRSLIWFQMPLQNFSPKNSRCMNISTTTRIWGLNKCTENILPLWCSKYEYGCKTLDKGVPCMGASSEINRRLFTLHTVKWHCHFVSPKLSKRASRMFPPEISQDKIWFSWNFYLK